MEDIIVVEDLVKKFGNFEAVKGVSFSVKKEKSSPFLAQTEREKPPPFTCSPHF